MKEGRLSMAGLDHPHNFDIHGGGLDLQFPHHENEIAQSCCAHPESGFANVWMHNEMLQVEGKKMSKSLGNFFTVRDLLDQGYPGEVIRMVYLGTHYSKPMDWTEEKATSARKTLKRWRELTRDVRAGQVQQEVISALADDLNTSRAISELHDLAAIGDVTSLLASAQFLGLLQPGFGAWAAPAPVDGATLSYLLEIQAWITACRNKAMKTKNFTPVDRYKAQLTAAGVEVRMTKESVTLVPSEMVNEAGIWAITRNREAEE